MTVTEARKRANAKYMKDNVKQVIVRFYPKDAALYEWVKEQGGAPWVREQLRRMMEEGQRDSGDAAEQRVQ